MGAGAGAGVLIATIGEGFGDFWVGAVGAGGGTNGFAMTPGVGSTTKLLMTVLTPATWATSPLAMVRAVSLVTLPSRVTTPPATVAWIDCPLRFWSDVSRCCTAVFRVASSGVAVLQPASANARDSKRTGVRVEMV
jgi:hypothetical protein